MVASDALTRLEWRQYPSLTEVQLECCSLEHLLFADCDRLQCETVQALSDVRTEVAGGREVRAAGGQGRGCCTALRRLLRCLASGAGQRRGLTLRSARCLCLPQVVTHRAGGCPRLQSLRVDQCDGLQRVAFSHSRVREVRLTGCQRLVSVALQCPRLSELDLDECGELQDLQLSQVRSGPARGCCGLLRARVLGRVCDLPAQCYQACTSATRDGVPLGAARRWACRGWRWARAATCARCSWRRWSCARWSCAAAAAWRRWRCTAPSCSPWTRRSARAWVRARPAHPHACLSLRLPHAMPALHEPALHELAARASCSCADRAAPAAADDAGIAEALRTCLALQRLVLSVCTSAGSGWLRTAGVLPSLMHLDLSYTGEPPGLPAPKPLPRAPGVNHLESSHQLLGQASRPAAPALSASRLHTPPLALPADVTDLRPVFQCCPALESLSLASCYGIDERSLQPITAAASPALPALRELDASYCSVGPGTVAALLATTRLESLALNGCDGVGDECFQRLRELAAAAEAGGDMVVDEAGAEGAGGHRLASLSLVRCRNLRSLRLGLEPREGEVATFPPKQYLASALGRQPQGCDAYEWHAAPPLLPRLRRLRLGLSGVQVRPRIRLPQRHCALPLKAAAAAAPAAPAAPERARLGGPLSRAQVLALALPLLEQLDVSSCSAMRYLELRCPCLAAVQAQDLCCVPQQYLVRCVQGCPSLRSLDLQHCRLSAGELEELGVGGLVRVGQCPAGCSICRHRV
jgi:hypothetical protein